MISKETQQETVTQDTKNRRNDYENIMNDVKYLVNTYGLTFNEAIEVINCRTRKKILYYM